MKFRTALLSGASLLAMTAHAHAEFATLGSLIITAAIGTGTVGLLPVASAAAIGLGALKAALVVGSLATSFLTPRPSANPNAIKTTTRGAEGQGRTAFGRVELKGKVAFGLTSGYRIYRLLLHCFGELAAVEEYFYDGRSITVDPDGRVTSPPWVTESDSWLRLQTKVGDGTETAWTDLSTDFPLTWTPDHMVRGIAQTLMRAGNPGSGSELFPFLYQGGIKETAIRGRVMPIGGFFDPRDDSYGWTLNGALHCFHYLRALPWMTDDVVDFDAAEEAAVAADVPVSVKGGGTAPRCSLSGGWEGPVNVDIVLDLMKSAGIEVRTTADGKYALGFIEDWPEPEVTITKSHYVSLFPQAGPDSGRRPNICKLTYFSPERRYETAEIDLTNAPWARIEDEIDVYGEQEFPVNLPFCCDASQAQRIARRLFYMARAEFGVIRSHVAGKAFWGIKTALLEIPDVGLDGASVFQRVRLEPVRTDEESGQCEIPYQVIPSELSVAWNPAVDEVDPPPVLMSAEFQELDAPDEPLEALIVEYPDGSKEIRQSFNPVVGGVFTEAVCRVYDTDGEPRLWLTMEEAAVADPVPPGALSGVSITGNLLGGFTFNFTTPASGNIRTVKIYRTPTGVPLNRSTHLVETLKVAASTGYARPQGDVTRTNLITDPTFTVPSWSVSGGFTVAAGKATKAASGIVSGVFQTLSGGALTASSVYRYAVQVLAYSVGTSNVRLFGAATLDAPVFSAGTGMKYGAMTATAAHTSVMIRSDPAAVAEFDNLVLYLQTGSCLAQGTYDIYAEAVNASGVPGTLSGPHTVTVV